MLKDKIVIFTNTFPYGNGETFLRGELPFISQKFKEITIFPLYLPKETSNLEREKIITDKDSKVLSNIKIAAPLLPFNHKSKIQLLVKGLFISKFASRYSIVRRMALEVGEFFAKKVYLSGRKTWIFFNYTLLLESIFSNKSVLLEVEKELKNSSIAYFYWGDKSALLIPFLKEKLKAEADKIKFVVRFHGSDIYESAKGYLPYREELYKNIDLAVPISENGAEYIRNNYKNQPAEIKVFRLGTFGLEGINLEKLNSLERASLPSSCLKIVSCSNVIELKRVEVIANALKQLSIDNYMCSILQSNGYKSIEWTHFGDGPLLESVKKMFDISSNNSLCKESGIRLNVNFAGRVANSSILKSYGENNYNLFVQVSRSEGIPVSIMEAYSCGIAVIATNVGGVSELFCSGKQVGELTFEQKSTGYLLQSLSEPSQLCLELCHSICHYAQLPPKDKAQMSLNAKQSWEKDWSANINYSAIASELAMICKKN